MENNTVSADNTNIKNSTGGGGIRRKRITRKYGKSRVNKRKHRRSLKKKMKKSIKKTRQYRKNRTMRKARRGGANKTQQRGCRRQHGISTGDPLRSAPRPHNRSARSLGRPERPLQAPSKSGNQKKIEFPHPTSSMYELRGH